MKFKSKKGLSILVVFLLFLGLFFFVFLKSPQAQNSPQFANVQPSNLTNLITASGDVEAENQANLTFLNQGRVAVVNFKEGDQVLEGQVIASLDNTIASHDETAAEAQYRSAQAALDKVLDDIHLFQYGNGGFGNVGSANETQTQKTQRQEAQEAVNVAYDNLQNAKKELEYSTIVAPFDGKILSIQDIEVGTNVTAISGNSVTLVGSGKLKFVADVLEQDINQIKVGMPATIKLDANKNQQIMGTVDRIAADNTVLPNGQTVIKVDIVSDTLQTSAQAGQTGTIEISQDQTQGVNVPAWTILDNQYIWVSENGVPKLKQVQIGKTSGDQAQIISGLDSGDQVILDPSVIIKSKYPIL